MESTLSVASFDRATRHPFTSILVVVAMTLSMLAAATGPVAAAEGWPDVGVDHPFHDEIGWLTTGGITAGYPDGTFRPGADVTRQAVAAFLYRLAGEPESDVHNGFSDVPPEHPFHLEISWAASQGITTGYPDGTFRPAAGETRQAIAAFLYRFAHSSPAPGDFDNELTVPLRWQNQYREDVGQFGGVDDYAAPRPHGLRRGHLRLGPGLHHRGHRG